MTVNEENVERFCFEALLHRAHRCLDLVKKAYKNRLMTEGLEHKSQHSQGAFYFLNSGYSIWSSGPRPLDSIPDYEVDYSILIAHYLN